MKNVRRVILALATIAMVGGLFSAPASAHIDLNNPHGPEVQHLEMYGHGIYDRIGENGYVAFTHQETPWTLDIVFNGHAESYRVTVNGQQGYCKQVFYNRGVAMEHDPLTFGHDVEAGTYVVEVQSYSDGNDCRNNPGSAETQTFTLAVFDPPVTLVGDHPPLADEFFPSNPVSTFDDELPTISFPVSFNSGF